ncbi:FAD-binding oxidoreductase [soil metagenome]
MSSGPVADLVTALIETVGARHVITDADVRATYEIDWTRRYRGECTAVVRPASTAEMSAVLQRCAHAGATVVPQGGNTGLVGGGVPRERADPERPCVVVSTRRLSSLGPVDVGASQVTAGAGVTLSAWRDHARAAGFDAPVDFAARDSATVGGAIATNAGGSRVVRFGTMRQQVMGVEAVLANGTVIGSLAGLPKETVGLHFPSLLAGSEGTLAIVTAARLRLVPWYRSTITAMISVIDLDAAVALLARLRGTVESLDAIELVLPEALALVADHVGSAPPVVDGGAYVLVDCAGHDDPTDELTAVLGDAPEVLDAAVTTDGPGREHLLAFRDRITEAINAVGVPFKLDVAVPVGRLTELLDVARSAVERHGGRLVPFGHLAEGNVHLNVLEAGDTRAIADEVLPAVASMGGTISAEHGVGVAKVAWLHLVRSPAELSAMAAVKHALDPAAMLNPGVLHPAAT